VMAKLRATLRNAAGHPRVLPLTALLLRARTVHPSLAFIARSLARSHRTCVYRLRHNGLQVAIRHGTGDVVTLGEVFHEHDYRPPAQLERAHKDVNNILDLGANVGLFGALAAGRWPHAQILAYEPDPHNAAVHQRTIALNALQGRWRLVRAAAGASDGSAAFIAGAVALSHLATEGEAGAVAVPVEDVLPILAKADLAKIDIEGGEWAILADPRFRASPPRALVLEYHPRLCPNGNPRAAAEAALTAAGLHIQPVWHRADGHGMLWAWRS
jgi:FkbM family methyltransferase